MSDSSERRLRELLWDDIGALDPDKYIIATFLAEIGPYPPKRVAEELAVEDSAGTWTVGFVSKWVRVHVLRSVQLL